MLAEDAFLRARDRPALLDVGDRAVGWRGVVVGVEVAALRWLLLQQTRAHVVRRLHVAVRGQRRPELVTVPLLQPARRDHPAHVRLRRQARAVLIDDLRKDWPVCRQCRHREAVLAGASNGVQHSHVDGREGLSVDDRTVQIVLGAKLRIRGVCGRPVGCEQLRLQLRCERERERRSRSWRSGR